ncbi:MAG: EAL domain-containing protein [Actinomycetales bacterium]
MLLVVNLVANPSGSRWPFALVLIGAAFGYLVVGRSTTTPALRCLALAGIDLSAITLVAAAGLAPRWLIVLVVIAVAAGYAVSLGSQPFLAGLASLLASLALTGIAHGDDWSAEVALVTLVTLPVRFLANQVRSARGSASPPVAAAEPSRVAGRLSPAHPTEAPCVPTSEVAGRPSGGDGTGVASRPAFETALDSLLADTRLVPGPRPPPGRPPAILTEQSSSLPSGATSTAPVGNNTFILAVVRIRHLAGIRDLWGLAEGERAVQEVLARTIRALPDAVLVGRLAYDDFGVIAPLGGEGIARVEQTLEGITTTPFVTADGTSVDPDLAFIVLEAGPAMTAAELLESAAFQLRLRTGRCAPQGRHSAALEARRTASNLEAEVQVWYQPIQELLTGEVVAFEALSRQVVDGEPRGIAAVLDVVESFGLGIRFDRHVVQAVLRDIARSRGQLRSEVRFAVNVSQRSLGDLTFAEFLQAACESAGVSPSRLTVEVSERDVPPDAERAVRTLTDLQAIGVDISLDDYGTGNSTLSQIKTLPISELKIDQSFVQGVVTRPMDEILVRSTIDLARSLGLRVVAEGVEDAQALASLRHLGCDYVQGFYFSRAQPLDDALAALERGAFLR